MSRKKLRQLIGQNNTLLMPGAFNPFSAMLIARAGFDGVYISGAGLANSLGMPDDGSLKLEDFAYFANLITRAVSLPVICDADTGLGANTKEDAQLTVKTFIQCGLAGFHIEDQVLPKRCGHLRGKEIVELEEMQGKIHQMVKTRDQLDKDFLIIARTDSRGADNINESRQLAECIERGRAYVKAGADMIFPESLRSYEEFREVRNGIDAPLLANMTEFGRTPMLTAAQFRELGYNIVIYPVSLFRFSAGQMKAALERIKTEGNQQQLLDGMLTRDQINELLDYKPE
jgi:methylisocitrate lyase